MSFHLMITISRFFVLFFSVFSFVFWPTVFEFEFGFGFGLMKYNRIYIFFYLHYRDCSKDLFYS